MTACDTGSDPLNLRVLLYCSVSLGGLTSTLILVVFAYKWTTQLDREYRNTLLAKLCALVVSFLAIERTVRIGEVHTRYSASLTVSRIWYLSNNIFSITAIIGGLLMFLVTKLVRSFEDSIHRLREAQVRMYQTWALMVVLSVMYFLCANGFAVINSTEIGRSSLLLSSVIVLFGGVSFITRINYEFSVRLKRMVIADSKINNRRPSLVPISVNREGTTISLDHLTNLPSYQKSLLEAVVRSMVIAGWISGSFVLFTVASLLFAIGFCADWPTIFGHLLFMLGYWVVGLSILLSMPHSRSEYHYYCWVCDGYIQRIVVGDTMERIDRQMTTEIQH